MTLPSDMLTRSADEAIRRIAIHLLDEVRALGGRILEDAHQAEREEAELRAALRSLELHLHVLGARFGVHAADGGLLELARDPATPREALAMGAIAFAESAATPLRTLSIELDASHHGPTYGVALAGVLRVVAAALLASLEDLEAGDADAAFDAREAALAGRDLLDPVAGADHALASAREACAGAAERALSADTAPSELTAPSFREPLSERLDAAARALEASTEREIEHKFLLRAFPPRAADADPKDLAQGYVPGERLHERLRRVRQNGKVKYIRTVKIGSGLSRMEIEEETTEDVFRAMWPLTAGCRIHKERYAVRDGALTWTIDRFVDRDLVLAEVEVPSSEIAPSPPAWLADYIVKDVTGDPAYVNLNLAR